MMASIAPLNPQPVSANLHSNKPNKLNAVFKQEANKAHTHISKSRHENTQYLSFCKSRIFWDSSLFLPGKLPKSPNQPQRAISSTHDGILIDCLCRADSDLENKDISLNDKGTVLGFRPSDGVTSTSRVLKKKGGLGELHVARARGKLILGNPSATVEKGKYRYDVETAIDNLSSLPPRGSVAKCLEYFKNKLSLNDFSLIFREFAQRGAWQRALRLFKYMQRQQWCKPNEHIYTIMIGILGREGLLDKCSEIFEEMPSQDVGWNVYSFTALINAYGRNGQYETSLHLLARMKRERIAPTLITYNTVINACAKGGLDWEGLLGLFAQMRHEGIQPDIVTYNTLLSACSSRGLANEAEMVFRTMNEAGILPNAVTYNYLVETFRHIGLLGRVSELLKELELAGNLPDITAYNLLLEAHAKSGMVKQAADVFRQMQEAGCTPNASTYSTLLNCYGSSGRYDDVRELFNDMKASSTEPDVITYNTLIDVFGKGGYFKEVVSLFHDMVEDNTQLVMESYEGLMFACGMGGLLEDAKQILQHMQKRGVVPTVKTFNGLIEAYGKATLYEDAVVAFNTMKEVGSEPNRDTYNSLIHMYARGGLFLESHGIFWLMHEAGVEKNIETFNGLIEAYGRAGDFVEALKIFRDMKLAKCPPNEQTHEAVLNVYCIAGWIDEGSAYFLEIKEQGLVPSITAYCLMLSMYARSSSWEDAYELLEEMQAHKMPNAHRVIGIMIKGDYDDLPNWQMVDYVFDNLKSQGTGIGMTFYNVLLDTLWWFGQKARAAKVLEEARKRGVFLEAFRQTKLVWSLDVHRMSVGAALTSLSIWLIDIRRLVLDGEDIPQLVSIVTVQGELAQKNDAKVFPIAKAVHSFLKDLAAPFSYAAWNNGRIIGNQLQLKRWLSKSYLDQAIALENSLLPIPGAMIGSTYVEEKEFGNEEINSKEKEITRTELTSV